MRLTIRFLALALCLTALVAMPGCLDEAERQCVQDAITALEADPANAEHVTCMQQLLTTAEQTDQMLTWLFGLAGASGLSALALLRKALKYRGMFIEFIKAFNDAKAANTPDLYKVDKTALRSGMSEPTKNFIAAVREKIEPKTS